MQTPSSVGTPFPFAAALAGKHVKVDLPKPSKFSRIAVDSDIRAWLLRMHEYLTISGIEQNVWVVFASNYLDKAPLQLWEARKTQLAEQPERLASTGATHSPLRLLLGWRNAPSSLHSVTLARWPNGQELSLLT